MMTQEEALEILKMGHNVYLTGPAGSGKTYILNSYIDFLKKQKVAVGVTASTGIAATHLGGMTIHSWAGIGIKDKITDAGLSALKEKSYLRKRFRDNHVLIIDEVSMLHHYRLDLIEKVCRFLKETDKPFGGMQVVLCGDFFQLPPVTRNNSAQVSTTTLFNSEQAGDFAYLSWAWSNMDLKVCYLKQQFRQADKAILKVLDEIRTNFVSQTTLDYLRGRYKKDPEGMPEHITPTKLYTHNIDVDSVNSRELEKLPGKRSAFEMITKGSKKLVETLKNNCLAPEKLVLKKGARVMFVKNNFDLGFVNGTLGVIVDFSADGLPVVETASGQRIIAPIMSWSIEDEGQVKAEIFQLPLRLAWAITVHKSQGMSLDAVEVDLSKSFEPGMGYVALSRVRTLKGLKLLGLNHTALKVHPQVLSLDKNLRHQSKKTAQELKELGTQERKRMQIKFIKKIAPTSNKKQEKLSTLDKTKLLVLEKCTLNQISAKRKLTKETIVTHLQKLRQSGSIGLADISHLNTLAKSRFKRIRDVFKKQGGPQTRLAPVQAALGNSYSYHELRLARLFLTQDGKKKFPDHQEKRQAYSIEEIRKNYPKAYAPWTKQEDKRLLKEYKGGKEIAQLAKIHGRQLGSIRSRLKKLNHQDILQPRRL